MATTLLLPLKYIASRTSTPVTGSRWMEWRTSRDSVRKLAVSLRKRNPPRVKTTDHATDIVTTCGSDIEMSMYFELLRTHTQSTQTRATHTDTYSLTTRTHSVNPLYYLSNTRSKWQRTHYSGPGV